MIILASYSSFCSFLCYFVLSRVISPDRIAMRGDQQRLAALLGGGEGGYSAHNSVFGSAANSTQVSPRSGIYDNSAMGISRSMSIRGSTDQIGSSAINNAGYKAALSQFGARNNTRGNDSSNISIQQLRDKIKARKSNKNNNTESADNTSSETDTNNEEKK